MVGEGVGSGSPKPDMVSLHRAVSGGEGWGEGVVEGVLAVLAGGGELGRLCTQQYLEHLLRLYLLEDRLVSKQVFCQMCCCYTHPSMGEFQGQDDRIVEQILEEIRF